MNRLRLALIRLFCVPNIATAAAETSCSSVSAIPGPTGYQRRANAERCEGFYQQQVAGSLEFLSLVNGQINYDLVSDKTLIVSVAGAGSVSELSSLSDRERAPLRHLLSNGRCDRSYRHVQVAA